MARRFDPKVDRPIPPFWPAFGLHLPLPRGITSPQRED